MKRKKYTPVLSVLLVAVLLSLVQPALVYIIFRTDMVQHKLIQELNQQLTTILKTQTTVSGVDVRLPASLVLTGVTVQGNAKEPLFVVKELLLGLHTIDAEKHFVRVTKVEIDSLEHHQIYQNNGKSNLDVFLENLSDTLQTDSLPDAPWRVRVDKIALRNSVFELKMKEHTVSTAGQMNFDHLFVSNIDLSVSDFYLNGNDISLKINNLSAYEQSGMTLKKLAFQFNLTSHSIELKKLKIRTAVSNVYAESVDLFFDSFRDFSDFNNKVNLVVDIRDTVMIEERDTVNYSRLYLSDVSYFLPNVAFDPQPTTFSGYFYGALSKFQGSKIKVGYGENTSVACNFTTTGLPDLENTFIAFEVEKLETNRGDINKLISNFTPDKQILPDMVGKLGQMRFNGRFDGRIKEFLTVGVLSTQLGIIHTNLNVESVGKEIAFEGNLTGNNFHAGKLLGLDESMGTVSLDMTVKGETVKSELELITDGKIINLFYNKYEYKNIALNGKYSNQRFVGHLNIREPNIDFNFDGQIDFSDNFLDYNFRARLAHANLYELNIDTINPPAIFSIDGIRVKATASNIDDLEGNMVLDNAQYRNQFRRVQIKKLNAFTSHWESEKQLVLYSDQMKAVISGNFKYADVVNSLSDLTSIYLPSLTVKPMEKKVIPVYDITGPSNEGMLWMEHMVMAEINIKDINPILQTFYPDAYISPNSEIKANYLYDLRTFHIESQIDSVSFAGNNLRKLNFTAQNNADKIWFKSDISRIFVPGINNLDSMQIAGVVRADSIKLKTQWGNFQKDDVYSGNMALDLILRKHTENLEKLILQVNLHPSMVVIRDSIWTISHSFIEIDSTSIFVDSLFVDKNKEGFFVHGKITESKADSLFVNVKGFDLRNLNRVLGDAGLKLEGIFNGTLGVTQLYETPLFFAQDTIRALVLNNQPLGNLFLKSEWDNKLERIGLFVNAYTGRQNRTKSIEARGYYFPKTGALDFDTIFIQRFFIQSLQPFVEGMLSNLAGYVNGQLKLKGTISEPILTGSLELAKNRFTVDFLNTSYNASGIIDISPNEIRLDGVNLEAGERSALIEGAIYHNSFSDIRFDFSLLTPNFQFLDLPSSDSAYFYGTAFAEAEVSITGTPTDIVLDINATTKQGTHFFIPLTSSSTVDAGKFVIFESETKNINTQSSTPEYGGLLLNFNLTVTPDAEVQIIFDEKVGDIIRARGEGDLKMIINSNGDFKMYGSYVISKGDYLFTLSNTLNKKFRVEKGGTISWNGPADDADLNLTAVYTLNKVGVFDLTQEEEHRDKKVQVNCNLGLSQKLSSPVLNFGIGMPQTEEDLITQLNSLPSDDLNKQIISLLILNRFQPLPGLRSSISASGVNVNTGELLANQLGHWLSQISNNLDVGVKYEQGDSSGGSELEVALSTQLLNERLVINGNFGVGSATTASGVAGDVDIEYKIDKAGKLRARAFTKTNDQTIYDTDPISYGLGIFFRHEFDKFFERRSKKYELDTEFEE